MKAGLIAGASGKKNKVGNQTDTEVLIRFSEKEVGFSELADVLLSRAKNFGFVRGTGEAGGDFSSDKPRDESRITSESAKKILLTGLLV